MKVSAEQVIALEGIPPVPKDGRIVQHDPITPREGHSHFICPVPSISNPNSVEEYALEYAQRMGFVGDKDTKEYKTLRMARLHELAERAYPQANLEDLKLGVANLVCLFFWDDIYDSVFSVKASSRPDLAKLEQQVLEIIESKGKLDMHLPVQRSMEDLNKRMDEMGAHCWRLSRDNNMKECLEGLSWEGNIRKQGRIPTLAEYHCLRLMISGVHPCLDITGLIVSKTKMDFAKSHLVQQLKVLANNHIAWVNDVYGIDKEIYDGVTANLVLVVAKEYGLSWEDAVDKAVDMCNKEFEAFEQLASFLVGDEPDSDIGRYVQGVKHWMRGNMDWYGKTFRYKSTNEGVNFKIAD